MAYTFQPTSYGTVDVFQDGKKITTTTPDNAKMSFGYTGTAPLPNLSGTQSNNPAQTPVQTPTLPNTSNQSPLLSFADSLNKAVNLARQNRNKSSLDIMKPFQGTVAASDFGAILGNLNNASDTFSSDLLKNANKANTPTYDTISDANGAVYQVQKDSNGKIIGSPQLLFGGKTSSGSGSLVDVISWTNLIKGGQAKLSDVPTSLANDVASVLASSPNLSKASQDAVSQADTVLGKIDEVLPKINAFTTGLGGIATANIPSTAAYDLKAQLDTIKANIGFSALQAMRNASPTGGALGQVSEQENKLLQSTLASIDQGQSAEQLKKNLEQIKLHFENLKRIVSAPPGSQVSYDKNGNVVVSSDFSQSGTGGRIRVRLSDGQTGTIDSSDFDPKTMTKI